MRRSSAAERKTHPGEFRLSLVDGVVLAEIYAAISYALANLEEITGEIETEDRMISEAEPSKKAEPAHSSE